MSNESIITEEMKSMIGMNAGSIVHEVDKTMLHRIAEAVEDTNPRWQEEAIPGFIFSAMVTGRGYTLRKIISNETYCSWWW